MKTAIRIIVVSASAFMFSLGAQAQGEGEGASGMPKATQSTASASDVKGAARMPVKVLEGSPGVILPLSSGLSREAVKAEALAAARTGMTSRGEIGAM